MSTDWLKGRRPPSVDQLVEAGQYAQAAAVLRAEFGRRPPTLSERLRLADLLVLADRGAAAVPILLEVADELARYGMAERALEALRRADAISPGHADVKKRFEAMARTARAKAAAVEAIARGLDAKTDPVVEAPAIAARPARLTDTAAESPLEVDRELFAFTQELVSRRGEGRAALGALLFSDLPHYFFRRLQSRLHRRRFAAGERDFEAWDSALEAANLDAIVYTDLGMHPGTLALAALRLAPLQLALWGHPVTTGLETIDAFASSDLLEPADAQRHYLEPLHRLPGLGAWYDGPAPVARQLYEETPESIARRERRIEQRRADAEPAESLQGRPTKREGRLVRRVLRGD